MLLGFAGVVSAVHFVAVISTVIITVALPSSDDASRGVETLKLKGQASLQRTIPFVAHITAVVVLIADPRLRDASVIEDAKRTQLVRAPSVLHNTGYPVYGALSTCTCIQSVTV